jgi:hypothetical protein
VTAICASLSSGRDDIFFVQFFQSRFSTTSVIGDRGSRRTDAGAQLGGVLLDLHAAAASVAHHAAPHVDVHRVDVDREPRRATFDDRREARAMRFTGGEKA